MKKYSLSRFIEFIRINFYAFNDDIAAIPHVLLFDCDRTFLDDRPQIIRFVWLNNTCQSFYSWWRHQMETFSALLAICAGNSPVPGEFPAQRPATRSFDVYFYLRPNKRLSKQSLGWWFETLSPPWWRHRNGIYRYVHMCVLWCKCSLRLGQQPRFYRMSTKIHLSWTGHIHLKHCSYVNIFIMFLYVLPDVFLQH